jgi:hypothetical protein
MRKLQFGLIALLLSAGISMAQGSPAKPPRKVAIFIENRAGAALSNKVSVLEDFLTSGITEKGYSVISREVVINALTPGTTKADQLLSDSTSALRLAQNMGADYLLVASITSLGSLTKPMDAYGVKTVNVIHTLRVSYKVLDGAQGGSLIADTKTATKTVRFDENLQTTENSDLINGLLEDAANQIAVAAGEKVNTLAAAAKKPPLVEITVSCGMQDLVQLPLSLPGIRLLEDGKSIYVSTNRLPMQVLSATVEIDGIAVGSAPGKLKVPQGLSKMRITRAGFAPYERTITAREGQQFNDVTLQLSEEGYKRWKDNMAFLLAIKTGDKLTDGLRELMAGFATTLRNSGYRVDTKTDVKATMEAKGKSLFDGATLKVFGE